MAHLHGLLWCQLPTVAVLCMCSCHVKTLWRNRHDIHWHWKLVGSVVVPDRWPWRSQISLEFFSSWYKLFLTVTLAWCLRALLWARAACKDVDGSLWKFFLVEFLACDILVIVSSLLLDLLLLFSYVLASFCFSTPCLVRCETSADTNNSSASITESRWWQRSP